MSGFSFIWLTGKCPAFISWGGQYIVILAEKDLVPFWSLDLERSKEMYGTFDFWRNCFREQCGVYIMTEEKWLWTLIHHQTFSRPASQA